MASAVGDLTGELKTFDAESGKNSTATLSKMISADLQVGDLLKIDYSECEVLVHDHLRQKVGGLPMGCFLLSTRINGRTTVDPTAEDSSLILLRVVGQSRLPNASETDLNRFLAGQRVAADEEVWDAEGKTDQFTLHQLRYAGVRCRVLGTFRMRQNGKGVWALNFGADISNFYSGRGMKVYKPIGSALEAIVNFARSKMDDAHPLAGRRVLVGRVRYSSSERVVEDRGEGVPVQLDPTDILARRTALFGMSRTGKSNTTKVIASSVYKLRESGTRVGQLIFDVNGEYANENTQDGSTENAACLKNVAIHTRRSLPNDVSTYGLWPHPNDPQRKIVKINFHGQTPTNWTDVDEVSSNLDSLLVGKTLIDNQLSAEDSKYIKNFRNTSLEVPQVLDQSTSTRYRRAIVVYRAALFSAGFAAPGGAARINIKRLFNRLLITAMGQATGPDAVLYSRASTLMARDFVNGDELVELCEALRKFIADGTNSGYQQFNSAYAAASSEGRSWHDDRLLGLLSIFEYPNGVRALRPLKGEHDPSSTGDYAQAVVDDLLAGRLVIFDQSLGDPDMNKAAAERIMWALFNRQKQAFVSPAKRADGTLVPPADVLVYAEEAHNLLPSGSGSNVSNIWSRVAKEGSKYRIGLVYATQEPSSIQSNIMKNTDNWFVAHLNNSDETKELRKYYDFDDFVQSILQVPDPGFLRMRTLSNPYIVPIQVARFRV